MLRIILAVLFAVGLAGALLIAEPASFAVAMPAMLLAFLVGGAALAIDLLEPDRYRLVADAFALAAAPLAFARLAVPVAVVLAVALAAQLLPVVARRWRRQGRPALAE